MTSSPLVLVVEDEKDLADLVLFNLQKAGYETLSARSGDEALTLSRTRTPDLVLLDLMLPGIPGTEVCRQLKSTARTRNVPVIMVTARGEEVDRVVGFELGADDFVAKPFSMRELILRIRAVLRRGENGESDVLQEKVGPIRIDAGAGSIASIGAGLLDDAGQFVTSPSGRFLLFSSDGSAPAAARVRRALSGSLLADLLQSPPQLGNGDRIAGPEPQNGLRECRVALPHLGEQRERRGEPARDAFRQPHAGRPGVLLGDQPSRGAERAVRPAIYRQQRSCRSHDAGDRVGARDRLLY